MLTAVNATDTVYAGGMKQNNSPANNTLALQAALDTGRSVHIPRGIFKINPGLIMKSQGQGVFGMGIRQTRLACSGDGDFFTTAGQPGCYFRDFMMNKEQGQSVNSGAAIVMSSNGTFMGSRLQTLGAEITNVFLDQMWNGVYITDQNTVTITNLNMQNMWGDAGIIAVGTNDNDRTDVIRLTHIAYSPNPSAVDAGRGTGLHIDGMVHSFLLYDFSAVNAKYGIVVINSNNLPFGSHASFLLGTQCHIDFPRYEAVIVTHIDRVRFVNSYFHGSRLAGNINLGVGVRDAKFVECNISGAYQNGLVFDGNILDVTSCEFDWNSQQGAGLHSHILLGNNAQNVRVVGGGATSGHAAWGIFRANPGTNVQLAAVDQFYGSSGSRNF